MALTTGSLWTRRQCAAVAVFSTVGLAVLLAAAAGIGRETSVNDQISWLNLGTAATVVATTSQAAFVIIGRHRVRQRRHVALSSLRCDVELLAQSAVAVVDGSLVSVAGGTWSHRRSCPLVDGKDIVPSDDGAGLEQCDVCAGRQ